MTQKFINQTFDEERALYNLDGVEVINCRFDGIADGESALKECKNVIVRDSFFNLRYSLWCVTNAELSHIEMTDNCRSPIWYSKNLKVTDSILNCVKVFRFCENVIIDNCKIDSIEFAWNAKKVWMMNSTLKATYPFFNASDVKVDKCLMDSNYAFQQAKNCVIENSTIIAKDSLWDSENVTCINCTIKGDYVGWYSKNLKLINCKISSSQPLCYANNLQVIDCTMEDCDLAFEYSSIKKACINGSIKSIKNPLSGEIEVDEVKEIITTNSAYPSEAKITIRNKE